jgi:Uma2 family endonuclease
MGSGFLHAFVLTAILRFLIKELEPKGFQILTGEVGFKFAPKSWYNLDIAIFEKGQLKEVKEGFLTTPPKIVIEIDTKADLRRFSSPSEYFHTKTQDLLDAGVEKVLWVFTKEKKVWLAEKGKRWIITDWNDEIELTDGVKLNLKKITEGV